MTYVLNQVTIKTDNSETGITAITELWQDIRSGKIPLMYDSDQNYQPNFFPIARYSNYESDQFGSFDLSIMRVPATFIENLEIKVIEGIYKKYDVSDDSNDVGVCVRNAWDQVWQDKSKRSFCDDYELSIPAEYSEDGKTHCILYISIK